MTLLQSDTSMTVTDDISSIDHNHSTDLLRSSSPHKKHKTNQDIHVAGSSRDHDTAVCPTSPIQSVSNIRGNPVPAESSESASSSISDCILYRLPYDVYESCLLYICGGELLRTLNLTCRKLHQSILGNEQYWYKSLLQLHGTYQYYNGPDINNIKSFNDNYTYYTLYRSLAPYIGLFGHFRCSNTVLGQYICGRYNTDMNRIELIHIDIDDQQYNNVISTVQLSAARSSIPYTYGLSSYELSHQTHKHQLQQHLATIQFITSNHTDTVNNNSHKIQSDYIMDYRGQLIDQNSLMLHCGSLLSRTDTRLINYLHSLTPAQLRRHHQIYYPNPSITLYRIRLIQSNIHTWMDTDVEQMKLAHQWYIAGFPSTGLYYGSFGAHGNELLYCRYENQYEFVAYKILGDSNVPSNKITFRIDCRNDNERDDEYMRIHSNNTSTATTTHHSRVPPTLEQQSHFFTRFHPYENYNLLPDINSEYDSMIVRAAAGHELDPDIQINDMTDNIDAAELTTEVVEDLHVVQQMMNARRLIPIVKPAVRVIHTRPGQGAIALQGYQRARIIPLQAHFHNDNTFTLDFLGLVKFVPYHCTCNNIQSHERIHQPTNVLTSNRT